MAITIPILTEFNGRGIDRGIAQFKRLDLNQLVNLNLYGFTSA